MGSYFNALRRYFVFSGRSTRAQFWLFLLLAVIVVMIAVFADAALAVQLGTEEDPTPYVSGTVLVLHAIPFLALIVRRLHDSDHSGWYALVGLIPLIGTIGLFVYLCMGSTPGINRFGPHPKSLRPSSPDPYRQPPMHADPYLPAQGVRHQQQPMQRLPTPPVYPDAGSAAPPPFAGPQPSAASSDPLNALERLAQLRTSGVIDEAEFQQMKADAIRRATS